MLTYTNAFRNFVTAAACVIASVCSVSVSAQRSDFDIKVQVLEEEIRAEVSMFVRASPQRVWDVITDYERAPEFMRDMQLSRILSRSGDTIRVLQKDQVQFGPFTFPVETVKDVRLIQPLRTESRLVSGSMKRYDARTELVPEAGGTRIVYRSQGVPSAMIAPFVTESRVKRETEERFKQVRAEILRREVVAARQ